MSVWNNKETIRTLPNHVDEVARNEPNTPWAYVPRNNNNLQEGYKAITFEDLSHAANKMARWIESKVGISKSRETIAYMDRSNDVRYMITILAANKTGYKIILPSTRNSIEGQQHLIHATGCNKFLHGAESKADVEGLRDEETQFRSLEIPSLEDLLQGDAEHYPSLSSTDPMEIALILHTSGSTGLPKPIDIRNGYIATTYLTPQLQAPNGRPNLIQVFFGQTKSLCIMPFFHAMGVFSLLKSILCQGPIVLPPPGRAFNAELYAEVIRAAKPTTGIFPPSILEDMVELPGGLEELQTMEFIIFGGAPLAPEAGDRICKVARIQTVIGSTEAGLLTTYINEDPKDWNYFEWCPWSGVHMEPAGDLHEAVVYKENNVQGAFYSFPEISEWRTKDLYAPHPTRPGLWQYRGRNDDVIVLSNGEKFNPIESEKTIEGHRDVKGALVVGQARFQAGLLVELNNPEQDPDAALESIWPIVEKANEVAASHGRVWKSKIAFAKPGKSFTRAPKGNIIRRQTNNAFSAEIDALYSNEGFADQLGKLDEQADEATVTEFVKKAIHLTMPKVPADVTEEADIFEYGVDSLQVLGLASALSHACSKAVKSRIVYGNPSIKSLTHAVADLLHGADGASGVSAQEKIAHIVEKYTADLPAPVEYNPRQEKHAVVVTGTTGSLGNYLLEYLIAAPNVAKIYALNRSDAEARQKKTFEERGANPDFSKVTFLQTSFDKDLFGLNPEVYAELQENVDVFYHNAWAVDFNLDLSSFEPTHIAGTRRVIDFSASARYHPHIVFISSVAGTGNWANVGYSGFVPEEWIADDKLPLPQGYGESKHTACRILALAAERSAIPVSIIRTGQLAGPKSEKGFWNKHEWLPSIVSSSKAIGKVPRTLGGSDSVDWLPTDSAAHVLVELVQTRLGTQKEKKLDVFHLVNPTISTWAELVPAVVEFYAAQGVQLEVVEFSDWIEHMKSIPVTKESAAQITGLKLLDFYEGLNANGGLQRMATEHTAESSKTLAEMGPIDQSLITNWLKQWNF